MNTHAGDAPRTPVPDLSRKLRLAVIDGIARCDGRLPLPGHVAMKVAQMAESEDPCIREMARVVATDPVLASRVLKIANSAAYCRGENITSNLWHAIARLGLKGLRDLIYIEAFWGATRLRGRFHWSLQALWFHGVAVGCVAQHLAIQHKVDPASAFLAGLLHDLGLLAPLRHQRS